ncbi:PAS domain S-box protein [Maridesulfovibrio sp. FT414]|uniref:PAS domain S-box protein n=1 Tax=Maridesulfovibrio sp. FT414 TaxID=2979469 RepID=UPI003D8087B8
MTERNKRFIFLASVLVFIAISASATTSFIFYRMIITEQKRSLSELVKSQAILASNAIQHYLYMEEKFGIPFKLNEAIGFIETSQQQLKENNNDREYVIGVNIAGELKYLIINGKTITDLVKLQDRVSENLFTTRMYTGAITDSITQTGLNSENKKIIAAYSPVRSGDISLGMVIALDLDYIKHSFIIANVYVFATCLSVTLLGLLIFRKFSNPIFDTIAKGEKDYRTLVENANSLIIKIDSNGLISFANRFATNFLGSKGSSIVGLSFLDLLGGTISDNLSSPQELTIFFGEGSGPHERICKNMHGDNFWIAWRTNISFLPNGECKEILCIGNDITSKYKALEQLKNSEARYKSIFENSPLGIAYSGKDGRISDCNDNLAEILGTTREKLLGLGADKVVNPKMHEAIIKAISGEKSYFEDTYTSITGGKTTFLRAIFNPVLRKEPPFEMIATIEDFTLRKKMERELAESERRFKGIAKASPVGIIITDGAGKVQYVNRRTLKLFNATREELLDSAWISYMHPADRINVIQNWFSSTPIACERLEFRIMNSDSTVYWLLGQIVEMEDTGNDTPGFVITITDISPLKDAELEHKRLTAVLDQSAEAILITDTAGIITYVNPAFELISGYSSAEIIGKKPNILKSGEHESSFYGELWETICRGNIWKGRFINLDKNGRRFTQDTTIAPVRNEEGTIVNFVSVARDITHQLIIEAQLRQAQKLESIGELAAGIAHEINTPTQYVMTNVKFLDDSFSELITSLKRLNNIRNLVQSSSSMGRIAIEAEDLITEDDLNYLTEEIPNAIKESTEGLRRIADIVKSVKQLAHPGETQKGFHDLNEIIRDAVTVSTNEWKYVADVEMILEEGMKPQNCLKGEMGQVILNLIVNSAHAIEQKSGRSGSTKGTIQITSRTENDSTIIAITDTGCGMPRHVIEKAFDPFFTTKTIGKGTGQGLAIAYNVIANVHQGSIVLESEEGIGTTVTIRLPTTN